MKKCIIRQPAGLGDIFVCQKIALKTSEKYGIPVIWPVIKEYTFLKNYIKNGIEFVDENEEFEHKNLYLNENKLIDNENVLFIPLHNDCEHLAIKCKMFEKKYKRIGLDYNDWLDYFNFERDIERENHLFYNILNLKEGETYNLINRMFGSPPHTTIANFDYPKNVKNIEIKFYEGINVFDWCKVFENANEIYTTDTCYIVLAEKLNLKCEKINIFTRREGDWSEIDYILKKDFNKLY
jgi:hypothetical protein